MVGHATDRARTARCQPAASRRTDLRTWVRAAGARAWTVPGPDSPVRAGAYSILPIGDVRGRGGHGPVQAEVRRTRRGRAGLRPDGARPAVAGAGQADAGPG